MATIEEGSYGRWNIKSFTDPDKVYDVKQFTLQESRKYNGAEYGCNCPAWRFSGHDRHCKHCDDVIEYRKYQVQDVTVGGKRFIVMEVQKSRMDVLKDFKSIDDNF
jgi:hypothetical protein